MLVDVSVCVCVCEVVPSGSGNRLITLETRRFTLRSPVCPGETSYPRFLTVTLGGLRLYTINPLPVIPFLFTYNQLKNEANIGNTYIRICSLSDTTTTL